MPGMDFEGATRVNESPILGSPRVHKATPRKEPPKEDLPRTTQTGQRLSPSAPLKVQDRRSYPTSDRLRSWMRESSEIRTIPIIGQPLTPPINFRDNFKSWIDDKALRDREFLSQQKISPGNTPLVANSPPTPQTTPPRQTYKLSKAGSQSASRNVSNVSTGTVRHVPESRTDSFRTACENLSSDDESHPPDSPSLHPSRQRWLRVLGLSQQKDVGLGLGLESDDDEPLTPKGVPPIQAEEGKNVRDFVTFNGAWGSSEREELKETDSLVTTRRDSEEGDQHKSNKFVEGVYLDSPTLGMEGRPRSKTKPRVKRREKEQQRSSAIAEGDQEMEVRRQSPWPLKDDMPATMNLDTDFQNVDAKRLSQASTTSARVEAMVIATPPQRRQTLRHTGRIMRLDELHQQQRRIGSSSLQSDDHTIKHQLRSARNPDQGLRKRYGSETPQARAQKSALAKLEGAPVVVVPDRRSSLQSSTGSSKHVSRTFSVTSKQQSSRPTTAPEDTAGYFDIPRRERGTVSVVLHKAAPLDTENGTEKGATHSAHARPSQAAAAASRELQRTTSATSGGLETHYIPQTPTSQGSITPQTRNAQDNQVMTMDRSNSGDWGALRTRSALVTPMSLRSAQSSTPGMLEVNEATAISIYPHTNKSILVIQEMDGRGDASPREQSAVIAGTASIALPGNSTRVITQSALPSTRRELTDSPLQNPREPPQPPDFKIIPPTPANAASSSEDTVRKVRSRGRSSRFGSPFTSLRRAMSARRYSESISNPFVFSRTLSFRDMTGRPRSRPMEYNKDSQLHPFWRPRSFWDGSDSDSEFGNNGTLSPRRPSSHGTAFRTTNNGPKRSQSLTARITSSLRSSSIRRPVLRRASVSLTSDIIDSKQPPTMESFADVETKRRPSKLAPTRTLSLTTSPIPPRTLSLSRKIGGSLRLPSSKGTIKTLRRPPQRSTTATWHNQPNYEFLPSQFQPQPQSHQHSHPSTTPPSSASITPPPSSPLRHLASRIGRHRSLRDETRREDRRNRLKGRIGFVPVKDGVRGGDIGGV